MVVIGYGSIAADVDREIAPARGLLDKGDRFCGGKQSLDLLARFALQ